MLDSRWEFSTTISPIMRGLKTLIDTCVDFKNLRSLAIIGKENYIVATFTGIFMAHYGHT